MRILYLLFFLLAAPLFSADIQREQLKNWIDTKKDLIIIDARTDEYDNGERLPGAILIPYDSSDKQLLKALPKKEKTIVVYCTNYACTACHYLAKKLQKLGYTNVNEYRGGLEEWKSASYPIQKISTSE